MSSGLVSDRKAGSRFSSSGPVVVEQLVGSGNWVCPAGVESVMAVLVAGGGGGGNVTYGTFYTGAGNSGSGGGGGGQVVTASLSVKPFVTYSYVCGAGGSGGSPGSKGNTTSFMGLVALGGGGGGANLGYIAPTTEYYGTIGGNGGSNSLGTGGALSYPSTGNNGGSSYGGGAGGGYSAREVLPITIKNRSSETTLYLGGGGRSGARWHVEEDAKGGINASTASYWIFASSVWTFYTATNAKAYGGGGGSGTGGRYQPDGAGGTDNGSNGGSGAVYVIYEKSPL